MDRDLEERNKSTIRTFLAALATNDMAKIEALLAPDFTWHNPQNPEFSPLAGSHDRAHFLKLREGLALQGDMRLVIHGMTAEAGRVAVEAESFANTSLGPYNNRYHFLFELRDGQLVVGKEYADSAYMQAFAARARKAAADAAAKA